MIIAIRIKGMVDVPEKIEETLHRMRLRRKYTAVLLEDSAESLKLLRNVKDYISYGRISEEALEKLVKHRSISINKKEADSKKIVQDLGKKSFEDIGIKPFFRLHPPRKGIESKKHAGKGKGVLGENIKISELVERML